LVIASAEVQTQSQDFFSQGIVNFQAQKWPDAQTAFEKALDQNPNNPTVLFNLGLVHYQQGHKGWAAALWRKALNVQPSFAPAQRALDVASRDLPPSGNEDDASFITQLRNQVASRLPWAAWLGLLWICLFYGGWTLSKFLGERKRNRELEQPAASLPAGVVVCFFCALFLAGLIGLKWSDESQPRATIVAEKVSLHLTPDAAATTLAELSQGSEVELLKRYQDWVQVAVGASTSGWIPVSQVFQTAGPTL
jgi:tetratricopeptide (TPR) repeat protein